MQDTWYSLLLMVSYESIFFFVLSIAKGRSLRTDSSIWYYYDGFFGGPKYILSIFVHCGRRERDIDTFVEGWICPQTDEEVNHGYIICCHIHLGDGLACWWFANICLPKQAVFQWPCQFTFFHSDGCNHCWTVCHEKAIFLFNLIHSAMWVYHHCTSISLHQHQLHNIST